MKWAVAVMGFEEIDALKRLIPNLIECGVKKILYFDGPFEYYPTNHESSEDGSLEYLKTFKQVKVIKCGRMTHMDKTTFRFDKSHVLGYDAMIFMDCDEYMVGDFKTFKKVAETMYDKLKLEVYNLCLFDLDMHYAKRSMAQRVYFNPGAYYYRDHHWEVFSKASEQRIIASHCIGGIQIFHDSTVRPTWREQKMIEFQEIYTPLEQKEYWRQKQEILPESQNTVRCHPCGCTMGYVYYFDKSQTMKARDVSKYCAKHKNTPFICYNCGSTTYRNLSPKEQDLVCAKCNVKVVLPGFNNGSR